ncbi:hypothetical protein UlMin_044187 [Ulmus minor]
MKILKLLSRVPILGHRMQLTSSIGVNRLSYGGFRRVLCTRSAEEPELKEFTDYMDSLKNYEKSGVPKGAGTDSDDGFDLGRMRRLMELLDNPHSKFKAIHIAGTKGKGSTAAFISNILRAEGYLVGCYTSPHIQTIRERISVGRLGEPVSAKSLISLLHGIKQIIDRAMELENGHLSHFEVLTAMAFKLFAQENVDIAVIEAGLGGARDATNVICSSGLATAVITTIGEEHLAALGGSLESIAMAKSGIIKNSCPLVLGGPFLPHIERIVRNKASSMSSPVVSASDMGNRSKIKCVNVLNGRPFQSCDIVIQGDLNQFFNLFDVKLHMLGSHQLQNAVTATCTALCLRNLGWQISDESIKAGLENTYLLGRSQFLTSKEVEALGLSKAMIMLDGGFFPTLQVDAVILTEANIAGGKARTTPATLLRDCWIQASKELEVPIIHDQMAEYHELVKNNSDGSATILAADASFWSSMKTANQILEGRLGNEKGIIVVTGSLHIVSLVLAGLHG